MADQQSAHYRALIGRGERSSLVPCLDSVLVSILLTKVAETLGKLILEDFEINSHFFLTNELMNQVFRERLTHC